MKNKSIIKSLIGWYLISTILAVVLAFIVAVATQIYWSDETYSNDFPYNISSQDKLDKKLSAIINLHGWVEVLDAENVVTQVYGTKENGGYSYTDKQLLVVTSGSTETENEFRGYLVKRTDAEGCYLVMINRTNYKNNYIIKLEKGKFNVQTFRQKIIVGAVILLYILNCLGICVFLHLKFRKPLKQILEGIWKMKKGEQEVQINLKGAKELTQIRDAFNLMAYSIQLSKEEKAVEAIKKQKMLLNLSHDIRTPIATINSCALALREGMVKEEDMSGYYQIIHNKALRVSNLTEDMFTLLKMQDCDYQLIKEKRDICEFLREQCAEYYCEAENENLTIDVEIPEEPINFEVDYALMVRVVGNLLSNAIKYNKTGNIILVKLQADVNAEALNISICDNGIPIETDLRTHLFDEFSRGDAARKTTGGTGLGLPIAKAIIEKHNGSIQYQYEHQMNCFIIQFHWKPIGPN